MRAIAIIVLSAVTALSIPVRIAAQGASEQPQTVIGGAVLNPNQSAITGNVASPMGQPLPNTVVQARNLLTGQIVGSTRSTASGEFSINGLPAGSYILEIVDNDGQIIGTSPYIAAAAGATAAASIIATSGAMSVVSSVTGLAATLTTTAAESVKFMAAAAGVAGVVTPPEVITASPSR